MDLKYDFGREFTQDVNVDVNLFKNLPGFLKSRRKQLGLNQAAVAKALGVSIQQISRYESGESDVPASRLGNLLAYLGLRHDDLGRFGEDLRALTQGEPLADRPDWATLAIDELGNEGQVEGPDSMDLQGRLERLERELQLLRKATSREL